MSSQNDRNGMLPFNPNLVDIPDPITGGHTIITEDNIAVFTEDFLKVVTEENL